MAVTKCDHWQGYENGIETCFTCRNLLADKIASKYIDKINRLELENITLKNQVNYLAAYCKVQEMQRLRTAKDYISSDQIRKELTQQKWKININADNSIDLKKE